MTDEDVTVRVLRASRRSGARKYVNSVLRTLEGDRRLALGALTMTPLSVTGKFLQIFSSSNDVFCSIFAQFVTVLDARTSWLDSYQSICGVVLRWRLALNPADFFEQWCLPHTCVLSRSFLKCRSRWRELPSRSSEGGS